jgi:hypothetical protein
MPVAEPKLGQPVTTLHRYVTDLVKGVNALLNMSVKMEGKITGIGGLRVVGNASEMRILAGTPGGDADQPNKIHTVLTLASSKNPSNFGDPVFWVATVAPDATGIITFYIDGPAFANVTVVNGVAVSPAHSFYESGNHVITARYSGDTRYFDETVNLTQLVNALAPPAAALTSNGNPAVEGFNVAFTLTLTPTPPSPPSPAVTGFVNFYVDGVAFGGDMPVVPASGIFKAVSPSENTFAPGQHSVQAIYRGDNNYGDAQDSMTQFILRRPTVALTVNPNPANTTEPIFFHAEVRGGVGSPVATGSVEFFVGGSSIGAIGLDGSGNADTSLPSETASTYDCVAHYNGDSHYAGGDSNHVSLLVQVEQPVPYSFNISPTEVPIGTFAIFGCETIDQFGAHVNFNGPLNAWAQGAAVIFNGGPSPIAMQFNAGQIIELAQFIFQPVGSLNFVNGIATNIPIAIAVLDPTQDIVLAFTQFKLERAGVFTAGPTPQVQWDLD